MKRNHNLDNEPSMSKHRKLSTTNITRPPGRPTASLSDPLSYSGTLHTSKSTSTPLETYNGKASTLPPLPTITSPTLARIPFTHQGSLKTHPSASTGVSYERLEFLGDAYIELIATRLLFPRFPHLTAGRLSQKRELLIKNETLAEYAVAYRFAEEARLPINLAKGAKSKGWLKTMGDIFEAYVAAVIVDDPAEGFQRAEAWLCALWARKLTEQPVGGEVVEADPEAKTELAKRVMGKGIQLVYKEEEPPEEKRDEGKLIFFVGVYLTGWGKENVCLGKGKGWSKKDAGAVAAAEALINPSTAQVSYVKRKYDEKVRAERERMQQEQEEAEKKIGEGREEMGGSL
ncbi:hypothetical protein MMC21_007438 [Puttea exsequens]|nr:hypothetical protein [Puttea exsequens]